MYKRQLLLFPKSVCMLTEMCIRDSTSVVLRCSLSLRYKSDGHVCTRPLQRVYSTVVIGGRGGRERLSLAAVNRPPRSMRRLACCTNSSYTFMTERQGVNVNHVILLWLGYLNGL